MNNNIIFIGGGNDGDKIAIELSRIYESMSNDIYYSENGRALQCFQIHSFTDTEKTWLDVKDQFIILAGLVRDQYWQEARRTLSEQQPYLILTIGIGLKREVTSNSSRTFNNECLLFPDSLLVDPVEIAQLVLQIFFMHMPWNVCQMGSIIGYDLADTKHVFEGKAIKVKKMTSDKKYYRQNFSKFLHENKSTLRKSEGILMSLWGKDNVLSISKANELMKEMESSIMPDTQSMVTFHVVPQDNPDFMTVMLIALREECR